MKNVTRTPSGGYQLNLEKIQKVSIDHIPDVISHRIMRTEDMTVHYVEFIREGSCKLSYTPQGKIIEFEGKNITTTVDFDNGVVILKALQDT